MLSDESDGEAPHGPGAGHAATLGCRCGYRVRARNPDKLRDHKKDCPRADSAPCPDCEDGEVWIVDAAHAECDTCDALVFRTEVGL